MPQAGYGFGVLVESHEGRPTKVDGNPDHPACPRPTDLSAQSPYGPSNVTAQASILSLYDPDRAQAVTRLGQVSSFDAFEMAFRAALGAVPTAARIRVLTETVISPALANQLDALLQKYPEARWHVYEPLATDSARAGARSTFGETVASHYRLDRADVIVSLDCDFLASGPAHLVHQQQYATRRRVRRAQPDVGMNRLYMMEASFSITGAAADHRLPLRPGEIEIAARRWPRKLMAASLAWRARGEMIAGSPGWQPSRATCSSIAARASSWPARRNRPSSTPWPMH